MIDENEREYQEYKQRKKSERKEEQKVVVRKLLNYV